MNWKYKYVVRIYYNGNYDELMDGINADYDNDACAVAEEMFLDDYPDAEIDFSEVIHKEDCYSGYTIAEDKIISFNNIEYIVNTAFISCEKLCYETAIRLAGTNDWRVIARYGTRNQALYAHKNHWIKEAQNNAAFYDINEGKIYYITRED